MRMWSLHPRYLDTKGIVALWRETLLAKKVLMGNTQGYRNHPQLNRFKESNNPVQAINQYLSVVYEDSINRGFSFNKDKIDWNFSPTTISVTNLQMKYERKHLLMKLKIRDSILYDKWINENCFNSHPLFEIVEGEIEDWEIIT